MNSIITKFILKMKRSINFYIFLTYVGLGFILLANKFPFFGEENLRFINNDFNYYYLNFFHARQTFGDVIHNWHFPLWNHHDFLGIPFIGNEFGYFYPFNILTYALGYFFFNEANYLFLVISNMILHIAIGAFFTFLCLTVSANISKTASFFGGLAFGFSTVIISFIGAPPLIQSAVWLPAAFYFYYKTCHENRIYSLHCAAAIAFSLLASYIYNTLAICTVLLIYGIFRFFEDRKNARDLYFLTLSVIFGFCLSLVQILPSFANRQYSTRQALTLEQSGNFSTSLINLVEYLLPYYMGHETVNYVGIITIVLIFISFLFIKNKGFNNFFIFIFVLFTLFGLGLNTYTHNILYYILKPIIGLFRRPRALAFVTCFSLAILSGTAFDSFFKEGTISLKLVRRYLGFLIIILFFAILQRDRILDIGKAPAGVERFINCLLFTSLVLFVFLIIARFRNGQIKLTKIFLILIVIVDLFTIDNKFDFLNLDRSNDQRAMYGNNRILDFVKSQYGDNPYRIAVNTPLIRYLSVARNLYQVGGYAIFISANFKEIYENSDLLWLNGKNTSQMLRFVCAGFTMTENQLNEQDGYKLYKIFKVTEKEYGSFSHIRGNVPFQKDEQLYIYTVEDTMPIFYFSSRVFVRRKTDFKKMVSIYQKGIDTVECPQIANDTFILNNKIRTADIVEVERIRNGVAIVNVRNTMSGFLFFADNFMPGWEAYVNNKKARIYRANHFMKALLLEPGINNVVFKFNPQAFKIGGLVTVFSWGIILLFVIYLCIKKANEMFIG